jgi:hypothetical protein
MHQLFCGLQAKADDSYQQENLALNLSVGFYRRRCSRAFSIALICPSVRRKCSM